MFLSIKRRTSAITNSEECTVEAHNEAMIISLDQLLSYSTVKSEALKVGKDTLFVNWSI